MSILTRLAAGVGLFATTAPGADAEIFDRMEQSLTWSNAQGDRRGRISGTLDLEAYVLPQPAPGVIGTESHTLFNPRLSVFLDAQLGSSGYVFGQARADRGFDPSDGPAEVRLDEFAVRWAALRAPFTVQVGKFATVVGSWAPRHGSWANPFITAPVPYEVLTGIWDNEPPRSVNQLLLWSHVRPGLQPAIVGREKHLRLPIIWGSSYATGIAVAGAAGKFRYAFEMKSAALSSRPDAWAAAEMRWDHPTFSTRVRYLPDERWELGWSASTGTYLRPMAEPLLAPSYGRGDYRQTVVGQDVAFAWHHLQVWAEIYAARFEVPLIARADTWAYYVETKYRFTPQFHGAVRWNQQVYGTIRERGARVRWGRNLWRLDVAPAYRVNAHTQLKLQYSLQRGDSDTNEVTHLFAAQATVRF